MSGQPDDLAAIHDFLRKGLRKTEGGAWGDHMIDLTAIYPDIDDRKEHSIIGITSKDIWLWSPDGKRLRIRGESKFVPPIFLADRLSRVHAGVRFDVVGTIDEEEIMRWTVQSGAKTLLDHGFYINHDPENVQWAVKNGVRLPDAAELLDRVQYPPAHPRDRCESDSGPGTTDMSSFEAVLDALGR